VLCAATHGVLPGRVDVARPASGRRRSAIGRFRPNHSCRRTGRPLNLAPALESLCRFVPPEPVPPSRGRPAPARLRQPTRWRRPFVPRQPMPLASPIRVAHQCARSLQRLAPPSSFGPGLQRPAAPPLAFMPRCARPCQGQEETSARTPRPIGTRLPPRSLGNCPACPKSRRAPATISTPATAIPGKLLKLHDVFLRRR